MTSTKPLGDERIVARDHQFRIGPNVEGLYAGAVHYWRIERDKWSEILDKVCGLGFSAISIYMPWEVHEIERGKFDFGSIDPRKDLDAFLTLAESKNLKTIARPGPQINSELTWFGYPLRILADPEMQAQNAQGGRAVLTQVPRPIPAVSYAVDKFFDETALWFDAIMPILAKHQYPNGGLISAQVDNEMAFFFHINPYACDFSPASIRRFRMFLESKYGTLAELNHVYGTNHASFAAIDAPRRFTAETRKDLPAQVDWIEYRERYLIDCLGRLAGMMRERGLDRIPLFHNYPHPLGPGGAASGITAPYNLMGLEEVLDFVGFDIYSRKELYEHVKTVASYVVGSSRFPYIPEFIAGVWPWYLNPGDEKDEAFVTRAALMHGIKGFSRYMLVERDRWLASPIRRDGRVRPENAAVFATTNDILRRYDFKSLRRQADVLLLANRDYDRLEAATELLSFPGDFLESQLSLSEYPNFMTVSEKTFDFAEPVQIAKNDWFAAYYSSLSTNGQTFLLSDTALPAERLPLYKAVLLSSFEFLGSVVQAKLLAYVKAGGTLVVGPQLPTLNERFAADTTLADAAKAARATPITLVDRRAATRYSVGAGTLVVIDSLADVDAVLSVVLGSAGIVPVSKNHPKLDVTIHRDPAIAGKAVVFVANPTATAIDAEVGIGQTVVHVTEVWEGKPVTITAIGWKDAFAPYTIKTYLVEA
ncbi:MAG: beta-galactosidase [Ancalomicrobiaceae bacterium]|nr:beta-galactosidase [Ancalomicrobiaceae bacterium]